jgi:hypothetical protein
MLGEVEMLLDQKASAEEGNAVRDLRMQAGEAIAEASREAVFGDRELVFPQESGGSVSMIEMCGIIPVRGMTMNRKRRMYSREFKLEALRVWRGYRTRTGHWQWLLFALEAEVLERWRDCVSWPRTSATGGRRGTAIKA